MALHRFPPMGIPALIGFYSVVFLLIVSGLNLLPNINLASPATTLSPAYLLLLWAIGFASCYASYRSFRSEPKIYALLLVTVLFYFLYYLLHENNHTYDLHRHKMVIRHWVINNTIPWFYTGGEFAQAQLYYIITGLLGRALAPFVQEYESIRIVTGLNYLLFMLYLIYGVRLLRLLLPKTIYSRLAVIAFLAWPNNMIQCSRITNDTLIYLSFIACTYHFMVWRLNRTGLNFTIAWLGVALGAKSSSGILVMGLLLICAHDYYSAHGFARPNRRRLSLPPMRPLILPLVMVMIGFGLGFGRNIYFIIVNNAQSLLMASGNPSIFFSPREYFTMDIVNYLEYPYIILGGGRSSANIYYWNFFLKSLSFGEFHWSGFAHAIFMNALIWVMLAWVFVFYLLRYVRRFNSLSRPLGNSSICLLFMALLLSALAYMKMAYGMHPWADTRHIYPFILFFIAAYCIMLEHYSMRNKKLCRLGSCLLASYAGLSLFHMAKNLV